MTKKRKLPVIIGTAITLAVVIPIVVFIYIYSLFSSFISLNSQVNDWHKKSIELLEEIPLERTRETADREAWQITYDFPFLIPYASAQITFVDDGSMTMEQLKDDVKKIAEKCDADFGGNKSDVITEAYSVSDEKRFAVKIKKRCRSLYSIF